MSEPSEAVGPDSPGSDEHSVFTRRSSLGYQVNHLARLMTKALAEAIEEHGVVPGQFPQLLSLYERDGQTVTELAADVAVQHPTMSRTLARMERDGLVERRPDPTDARTSRIHLTERAREIEPHLLAAANEINAAFLAPLAAGDRDAVIDALGSIVDAASR